MTNNLPQFKDISAKQSVEIRIRADGLVIWVNTDGICIARIVTSGFIPIKVDDDRK